MVDSVSGLTAFCHATFGKIRVIDSEGEPWFLASDVCECLGTQTNNIRAILDEDEVAPIDANAIGVAGSGGRDPLVISESGLYSLILRSRKQAARPFSRWVTRDVLPGLRRTQMQLPSETLEQNIASSLTMVLARIEQLEKRQDEQPVTETPATSVYHPEFGQAFISCHTIDAGSVNDLLADGSPLDVQDDGVMQTLSLKQLSQRVEKSTNPRAEHFLVWVSQHVPAPPRDIKGQLNWLFCGLHFPPHGYVYLMKSESAGLVKIGYSSDPQRRLLQVKNYIPDAVLLDHWFVKTPKAVESHLHNAFAKTRQHGEWFSDVSRNQVASVIEDLGLLRCKKEIDWLIRRFAKEEASQ